MADKPSGKAVKRPDRANQILQTLQAVLAALSIWGIFQKKPKS